MKRITSPFLSIVFVLLIGACTKEEEAATNDCKTCRALGSTGTIEKQVCSPAEEQAFRNEHAGREISCR